MEEISLDRQRELIEDLARLIAERARSEVSLRASFDARLEATQNQFGSERERLTARIKQAQESLHGQHTTALSSLAAEYERGVEAAAGEHDRVYRTTVKQTEAALVAAKEECELDKQRAEQDYNAAVQDAHAALQSFKQKLEEQRAELHDLDAAAGRVVRRRRCRKAADQLEEAQGAVDPSNPLERFADEVTAAKACLHRFPRQRAPRLLRWWALALVVLVVLAVAELAGLLDAVNRYADIETLLDFRLWIEAHNGIAWSIASSAVALGVAAILYVVVRPVVVRQTLDVLRDFRQHLASAHRALDAARAVAVAEADQKRLDMKAQLDRQLKQLDVDLVDKIAQLNVDREARLKQAAETLQQRRKEVAETRDASQAEVNRRFAAERQQLQESSRQQTAEHGEREERELASGRETFQRSWDRLVGRWQSGMAGFQQAVEQMNEYCQARFPDWQAVDWETWNPPQAHLQALRFGSYTIGLEMFEHGVPAADEMRPPRTEFSLPAVMSFAARPSLLLEAWGEGRIAASRAMQNVMLRLLTSLPPGKVRFTIIDPVGLGQNFSAFMHLADFDERLVSHRIWTESGHIMQRLTDLTEHMEDVIQTYLRNEFQTIDEYNRHAGEVAEPFHVLVVANFPAGFSDEAAARLLSIVGSGARCGVYSLISVDTKLELPRNFDVGDLEAAAATVQWNGNRFCWLDEDVKDLPLALDEPPGDERFTDIIRAIGRRAKEANRVEVPFATVAAPREQWWTHDSRGGIEVALGRAGATKLQYLRLGQGTSQHVLISGKTGSGKSTLLHALVANTALHYSPREVQFFLIDFKKGVEFKAYAALQLPHARVVAIESEREFGMSVLERLDVELRARGDLFRQHGVQDIHSFRDANPDTPLPRLLLIIDEFQEFFVQDDKLSQDAALLLDRLVRQGRAFGIHVLLGSQTLAGAYSLARSTIGQMAVRIALQCSEADSHLILSEDNTAARLLSRPGEAIYNDANGLFEGNHPFQVVWLPSAEQERLLSQLAEMGRQRRIETEPPIVFEGNAPADPAANLLLRTALESDEPVAPLAPTAWLGAAVSIKAPTAVVLRRQSASNLLMVGQQEETAIGVLANCVISLAAACAGGGGEGGARPRFLLLDGTRAEAPLRNFWPRLADRLPLDITVAAPRQAAAIIADLAGEVARRVETGDDGLPAVFLVVYNLSRFRELRRSEDDFSFSMDDDKPAAADKQFVDILREGPAFGVHTLIWSDTYNTLNRTIDRQALRELDQRVLLQMSATDSANLMDSPAASRLGVHRGILYSEEHGQFEKFRPYGPPPDAWLDWVKQRLAQRTAQAPA